MINKSKNSSEIEPFTAKELAIIELAKKNFSFFLQQVYSLSFEGQYFEMADGEQHPFSLGTIHYVWAQMVELNPRICILAPRMHLKSTIMNHAFSFWQLFKASGKKKEGIVVSYNEDLAREHTGKIKEYIRFNPFCRYWIDNKPTSESVVDFQVRFNDKVIGVHGTVDPYGINSNLRGKHPNFLICDDILTDFKNQMETTQIATINNIFASSLSSLPNKTEPLIVIGTPQSYDDTLYVLKKNPNYVWARFPAEQADGVTLWPEKFDLDRLYWQRREVGETAYQVEYLLIPFLSVMSFLPIELIESCVDKELEAYDLDTPFYNPNNWPVYGGMDIGKEVHPTHLSIGVLAPTGDIIQVYEKFLDGMNYRAQAAIVSAAVKHFKIRRLYFDATRGEFEDRVMSKSVLGRKFTKNLKKALALSLEGRMGSYPDEPRLILLNNPRMIRQMASVNKELQSIETPEGHGDSFWSIALMVRAAEDGPVVQEIGNAQDTFGGRGKYRFPTTPQSFGEIERIKVGNS